MPRHDGASEVHQVPGRFAAARRWCGSVLSLVAVVALVSASGAPHRPGATRVESVAPNVALNTLWNDYGDQSDRWSGADGAASVPLPDGRTAWLFSDTFLGTVNADHSRPRSAPFVNNSIVVQDGRQLTTVTGGTPRRPAALVRPSQGGSDSWYWVGDGTVQGHELKVFYNSYRRVGNGPLDIALTGSALATFQLPTLALREVAPLPGGNRVAWGSAVVEGPRHTYVYGSEIGGAANFAHIARARTGALTSGWEYWAGDGWSGTEAESARLLSGVGTGFSVDRVGGRYLLVTQELRAPLSPHIVAYSATSPIGPFGEPTYLYRAPETGTNRIIYDARLHPELSTPDRLVLSYNANTLDAYEGYWNARIYRPRFVDVTLGDRGGPARAPAPPARVRASSADGAVRLSWDGIDGAVGYRVYMRDMTAGQTGFGRLSYPVVDGTATTVGHLVDGHRYEFVITAFDGATESTPSPVARATVDSLPPGTPGPLRAVSRPDGAVALDWTAASGSNLWYLLYQRDLTARQATFTRLPLPISTGSTATVRSLVHGHLYEFRVTAVTSAGESLPTQPAQAASWQAPPAPARNLRVRAIGAGRAVLTWDAPRPDLSYWIFQRDRSAGQLEPVRLPLPLEGVTDFLIDGLGGGREYEFTVVAATPGGLAPASEAARVRVWD